MWFQHKSEVAPIQPDILGNVFNIPVTNAMLMGVFVTVLILIVSLVIRFRAKLFPSRFQTAVEIMVEGFLGLTEQILGSRELGKKMLPLIGTIFVFFGVSNLIGLIPGLTAITYGEVSLFRTPTNDFNMTFSVALAMVVLMQFASMKEFGFFGHLGKFFKIKDVVLGFRKSIGDGMIAIIDFLIGLLDIISEFAKVISLSLRLFGNMYAGEVLAAILLGAFALVVPSTYLVMNILVGVIQALVFGALTAAYYQLAVARSEN